MQFFEEGDLDDLIAADGMLAAAINKLGDAVNEANLAVFDWICNHGIEPPNQNFVSMIQDRNQLKHIASFFKQ